MMVLRVLKILRLKLALNNWLLLILIWDLGFGDKDAQPKYQSQVKDGKPNGIGVLTFTDGWKYIGEWKDGIYNGQGIRTYPWGEYVGEWKDGKGWNGTTYDKNGNIEDK